MKPNKEKKPKLFKDYVNKVADLALPIPRDDSDWLEIERTASIKMINDLANQIHELNEKMDFIMEGTAHSNYYGIGNMKDSYEESLKKENNESI